jgi:hypothetical protein
MSTAKTTVLPAEDVPMSKKPLRSCWRLDDSLGRILPSDRRRECPLPGGKPTAAIGAEQPFNPDWLDQL